MSSEQAGYALWLLSVQCSWTCCLQDALKGGAEYNVQSVCKWGGQCLAGMVSDPEEMQACLYVLRDGQL